MFRELKIQKPRGKKYTDQYLNVCLVLNNDIGNENCTGKISYKERKNKRSFVKIWKPDGKKVKIHNSSIGLTWKIMCERYNWNSKILDLVKMPI